MKKTGSLRFDFNTLYGATAHLSARLPGAVAERVLYAIVDKKGGVAHVYFGGGHKFKLTFDPKTEEFPTDQNIAYLCLVCP